MTASQRGTSSIRTTTTRRRAVPTTTMMMRTRTTSGTNGMRLSRDRNRWRQVACKQRPQEKQSQRRRNKSKSAFVFRFDLFTSANLPNPTLSFACRRNSWNSSGSESESDFESESERPLNSRRPPPAAANRRPVKVTASKARPTKRVTNRKGKYQSSDESGSDYSEEERRKYGGGR